MAESTCFTFHRIIFGDQILCSTTSKDYFNCFAIKCYFLIFLLFIDIFNLHSPFYSADGNFEVTLSTKATLYNSGRVEWKPPAIYHSSCEMDVEYFPFDEQTCVMKFGSWTYDGYQVDLRHQEEECTSYKEHECTETNPIVNIGVDLSEFYMSVEWDILAVPAIRNVKFYTCCDEPYLDITFNITMRRKTLFYTVNLIIPCMGISFLTVLVFYLPSDSGEKASSWGKRNMKNQYQLKFYLN